MEAGSATPAELICRHQAGFLRHRPDRSRRQRRAPATTAAAPPASGSRTARSPIPSAR
jgi:hypothetical protein